jgi:hypothetical protein
MAIYDFEGDIWKPAFAIRCFTTGCDKSPQKTEWSANDIDVNYERTKSLKQGLNCFQMLAAEDINTFVAVDESWMALMHL